MFRNVSCTGKVDMYLEIDGNPYQIDVKLAAKDKRNCWRGNADKVKDPVIPVLVIPDGDICNWKIKWIRNRYPVELKHFWDKPIHLTLDGNQIKD